MQPHPVKAALSPTLWPVADGTNGCMMTWELGKVAGVAAQHDHSRSIES